MKKSFLFLFIFILSRGFGQSRLQVEQAMDQYNSFIMSMNTDSIAFAFTQNGYLGDVANGRDSIKIFLNRFKEFRVLSQKSSTNDITITGDSAVQNGRYWQTTIIPPNDTVHVKGKFTARWQWLNTTGWKLQRMDTYPER